MADAIEVPWRPIAERPEFDQQPITQIVWLEGARTHFGGTWQRCGWGVATIERDARHGYAPDDIWNICERCDIDFETAEVTHWAPAAVTRPCRVTAPKAED